VYTDGASRGNPGPAAAAVKIVDENGRVLKRVSKVLGKRTNNEAEYEALIMALSVAGDFTKGHVHCFLDSELVVKQLVGKYRVRNSRLRDLWFRVHSLQERFQQVTFSHISREDKNIREVDKQANRVLDKMLR
jgi:ribonuclease HI